MEKLKAKLKKQGGFTLIEMLIVVAIIAILIAVSIPLVNNALDRARQATDAANERSAKAEIMIQYLSESYTPSDVKCYDAEKGSLVAAADKPSSGYGKYGTNKGGILWVSMLNNVVYLQWTAQTDAPTAPTEGNLGSWKTAITTVDAAS